MRMLVVTNMFSAVRSALEEDGMNFKGMPELAWRYGYLYVILLAGAVALVCISIFRRRHWM